MFDFGIFFVITASVIFWFVFLAAFVHICRKSAGKPDISWGEIAHKFINTIASEQGKPHIYIKVAVFGLYIRLAMLLLGYLVLYFRGHDPTIASLLESFVQGDAPHYLNIAEFGYGWTDELGRNRLLVFFPLYPYMVRALGLALGNYLAAAYIISFAGYCVGLIYLYRLVRVDFSARIAWWTVILLSVSPHSFFFGAPYTESLFLLTTVTTLYYIRTHKWLLAGIAGAFAASSRMVGIILFIVAVSELIMHYKIFELIKNSKWREALRLIFKKGAWLLLMFLGSGFYLFINWQIFGDPFRFLHYQEEYWSNTFQYFGTSMMTQFSNVTNPLQWGRATTFVPNITAFAFAILMLFYAHIKRLNAVYIVYTLGYIFISFSPAWLLSGGRYAAACATLFIFLAHFIEDKPKLRIIVTLAFFAGLMIMMGEFIVGGPVF